MQNRTLIGLSINIRTSTRLIVVDATSGVHPAANFMLICIIKLAVLNHWQAATRYLFLDGSSEVLL